MTAQSGQGCDVGAQKSSGAWKGDLIQLGSGGSKQASGRMEHLHWSLENRCGAALESDLWSTGQRRPLLEISCSAVVGVLQGFCKARVEPHFVMLESCAPTFGQFTFRGLDLVSPSLKKKKKIH